MTTIETTADSSRPRLSGCQREQLLFGGFHEVLPEEYEGLLQGAIQEHRVVAFDYLKLAGHFTERRVVNPLSLGRSFDGKLVLTGDDLINKRPKHIRSFRLDRMSRLVVR